MRIKHTFLQNFCKFYGSNVVDTDLYDRTEVSGVNETGKSTIKRAIQYIFGCRDENGREITGIRPHDKDGNDIDGDITAEVTVEIDGTDNVLKKVCRQNFNKKGEFTGNVTDYYVNNIPKKAADFEAFLEESVCGKEKFSLCINAMTLLLKGGTDQRAILADMFGQHSNDDICNQFPEFEALRTVLQDGTVDELKKRCNTQLYGTRGRNGTKGLQDLLDEIPSRIDEVSRQRVDIDLADLELKKKALLDKLSENIKQQTNTQNSMISYDSTADTVNYNLNKEADEFNVYRRITVTNARTDMIMLQAEGYMALSNNSANELVVTFKTGENQYYKDYIYLNDWTCYVMEQVEPKSTDRYHYELVFYPDRLIPDIEIK